MSPRFRKLSRPVLACAALALAAGALPAPGAAQSSDERVRRLEAEVRALQRAVFPGGDGRYFEPEISSTPQQVTPVQPVGRPAESAMTDVLARLSSIESQLARLTAASEVNSNALEQLEARIDTLEQAAAGPVNPTGIIPVPTGSSSSTAAPSGELAPARQGAQPAPARQGAQPSPAAATQSRPTPERVAAVQAIAKPATEDPGDDDYTYGFRLWDAGFYPEAQQQLALFLDKYPRHSRTSFARNLLGRAYLDAGDPGTAAQYFLQNYQSDKQGARAPDSLLYLAESMIQLNDTNRACIALAEFGDNYPALATGRLKTQYDANRGKVDCE